jgi:magnesium-transporting ATPase (P-type)
MNKKGRIFGPGAGITIFVFLLPLIGGASSFLILSYFFDVPLWINIALSIFVVFILYRDMRNEDYEMSQEYLQHGPGRRSRKKAWLIFFGLCIAAFAYFFLEGEFQAYVMGFGLLLGLIGLLIKSSIY